MATTLIPFGCSSPTACMAPSTAAPPHMSNFISSIPPGGLRLMPPESKVKPLPTRSNVGLRGEVLYSRITIFGGWAEPLFTPNMPPIFKSCIFAFDRTLQEKFFVFASFRPNSAKRVGVQTLPGSFAISRAVHPAEAATLPFSKPFLTGASTLTVQSSISSILLFTSSFLTVFLYFSN